MTTDRTSSSGISEQFFIDLLKQKVIKNNQGLGICYGQALMKVGHKILIANPIGMFLVEIPGSPDGTTIHIYQFPE